MLDAVGRSYACFLVAQPAVAAPWTGRSSDIPIATAPTRLN